ncbi:hypothetical protein K435DRAFT_469820 [Dendrothele bispora CBS 962.96]|uniref:Uncharacterized protein n=1 Tax=Dendrothele bispora (strain CBS 962.96) TaxID=1314807 RepID=A0A4S8KZZ1_DENBC|nr:hypothetical protein K435DRAFT_469820 [Dendrothele bispora CBS 962.96]
MHPNVFPTLYLKKKNNPAYFLPLLTRIIPSMAIAVALGRPKINLLLVTSQVVLSVLWPFISFHRFI